MPCTGTCCVCFYLPKTPDQLRAGNFEEGKQIADMVIPLTLPEIVTACMEEEIPLVYSLEHPTARYTCKHFDRETRLCGNYDNRPHMCRDFPGYGSGAKCCFGCDCTDRRPADELVRASNESTPS
jgi:Fe-S-cluster containining protein